MKVTCPGCGVGICTLTTIKPTLAQFHCPKCGKDFGVSLPAPEPASVVAAATDSTPAS